MYSATTRSIQVSVKPHYMPERSAPGESRYFWAYTVEVSNKGEKTVQLLSRNWNITNASGEVEEVSGLGVVGEQPVLEPGARFEYTSGVPLTTPSGFMRGSYLMQTSSGERFEVTIPAFSLDLPDSIGKLN